MGNFAASNNAYAPRPTVENLEYAAKNRNNERKKISANDDVHRVCNGAILVLRQRQRE